MTHWTLLRNFIDANQASIELLINRYSHITTDKLYLRCVTAKSCLSRRTHNMGIIDTFYLFWDYGVSFQKRWDPTSGVAECCLLTYSTRCRPMWLTVLHLRVSRESSLYRTLRSVPRSSSSPFPWTAAYLIRSPIPSGAPLLLQPETCKRNYWTSTIMNNVLLSKSIPLHSRPGQPRPLNMVIHVAQKSRPLAFKSRRVRKRTSLLIRSVIVWHWYWIHFWLAVGLTQFKKLFSSRFPVPAPHWGRDEQ